MYRTGSLPFRGIPTSLSLFFPPTPVSFIQNELAGGSRFSHTILSTYSKRLAHQSAGDTVFNPSNRLYGRTCMITGGSSGIGYAIAERFLQEGATRIILVGRSYERLSRAAIQLEDSALPDTPSAQLSTLRESTVTMEAAQDNDSQCSPTPKALDKAGMLVELSKRISLLVGDVSEAGTWARELETAMKPVDILVNAAGISTSSMLAKSDPQDISRVLRTNLEGAVLTSRALIRAIIRNRITNRSTPGHSNIPPRSKCIINISSLLALKGGTGAVPYAASKAGVLGLTRSLTVEAAESLISDNIRSNAIIPGYIETPMIADFNHAESTKLKDSIPLRRFGAPQEVADAAAFLAYNEYANNCVINLDGGLSAL